MAWPRGQRPPRPYEAALPNVSDRVGPDGFAAVTFAVRFGNPVAGPVGACVRKKRPGSVIIDPEAAHMTYENPLRAIWNVGTRELRRLDRQPGPDHRRVDCVVRLRRGPRRPAARGHRTEPAGCDLHRHQRAGRHSDYACRSERRRRDRQVARPGAQAIVIPMVNNGAEAARAVAACRFPPHGVRSMGPIRAHLVFGSEEIEDLESPVVMVMVETAAGLANVDEIAATPGVDAIYIGPADLSIALGVPFNRGRRTPEQAARPRRSRRERSARPATATGSWPG